MKKFLFSLSALMCTAAMAEIQVDFKIMHNEVLIAEDRTILNESDCCDQMRKDANNPDMQIDPAECKNGMMNLSLISCDESSATIKCTICRNIDDLELMNDSVVRIAWNEKGTIQMNDNAGDNWLITLTPSRIDSTNCAN